MKKRLKIPITKDYKLILAITNFQNFGEFGTQSDVLEARPLSIDAPTVSMGFTMSIPGSFEGSKPTFKNIKTCVPKQNNNKNQFIFSDNFNCRF